LVLQRFSGTEFLTVPETPPYTDRVFPRRFAALAAVLAAALCGAALRAQTNQRAMYVSVVNDQGAPVTDLGPADFVVREDGVAREVLTAAPAADPMQIALVVDNSQAARDSITDLRRGLQEFVDVMTAPSDDRNGPNELAIVTVADRPTMTADYSSSRVSLTKGVERIFAQPGSGMYLLDALVEVVKGIDKRQAPRPVIVAIVTEGPEFSTRYYTDVLKPLAASGATFYAFTIGPPASDMADETRNRSRVLDEGTKYNGGAWMPIVASLGLPARLKQLADQLTHEYKITYGHPQSLIPPEHVTVEVKRPGLTARGTPVKEQKR
jgi:hypothetical protein